MRIPIEGTPRMMQCEQRFGLVQPQHPDAAGFMVWLIIHMGLYGPVWACTTITGPAPVPIAVSCWQ